VHYWQIGENRHYDYRGAYEKQNLLFIKFPYHFIAYTNNFANLQLFLTIWLSGLDALLSTVQMPSGVPVATVAIGKAGAKNAAVLAVQILALSDKSLAGKLARLKATQAKEVAKKDSAIK
jgi:hypothetical protein